MRALAVALVVTLLLAGCFTSHRCMEWGGSVSWVQPGALDAFIAAGVQPARENTPVTQYAVDAPATASFLGAQPHLQLVAHTDLFPAVVLSFGEEGASLRASVNEGRSGGVEAARAAIVDVLAALVGAAEAAAWVEEHVPPLAAGDRFSLPVDLDFDLGAALDAATNATDATWTIRQELADLSAGEVTWRLRFGNTMFEGIGSPTVHVIGEHRIKMWTPENFATAHEAYIHVSPSLASYGVEAGPPQALVWTPSFVCS